MQSKQDVSISFEIFPPKTEEGFQHLHEKMEQLNQFNPNYISVTFGAAGSAQPQTQLLVQQLIKNKIKAAPHISCINMTKQRMSAALHQYVELGIRKLVVIRGDYPPSHEKLNDDFKYANELVAYVREKTGNHFHISVAAYPEFHPQAHSPIYDLENFKRKVETGANSAITQYFFNSDAYFHFLENCHKYNIHIPIIPGIMPIIDYEKLKKFSALCGAEIPLWIRKRLEDHTNDSQFVREFGIEVIAKLCEKLIAAGVNNLHFYTLNQLEPTVSIIRNLNINKVKIESISML